MGHPPRFFLTAGLFIYIFFFTSLVSSNKCTTGCHGMHIGKDYQEGQTYTYDLEGKSLTSVSDAQGEASLKLKATVELAVKPECIRQIKLKNVVINGEPVALKDVEQYPLQFNYHNGHIDTELCAEPSDSQASLNIKRAVISLFQSAVIQEYGSTTHHEADVFGGCTTDFSFQKEDDSVVVHKYRNLNECAHRETIRQGLISTTFDPRSTIQSTPLLSAQQKVEQRFKSGVLNKAVSTETYKFRPFTNGEAGAKTIVETTLTLKGQKDNGGDSAPVSVSKSLFFEAPHPVTKSSVDSIVKALDAVKEQCPEAVKPEAAQRFAELVKVLGISSKKDIIDVYKSVNSAEKAKDKKIFLDALFRAGSGEAAEVAIELITSAEVSGVQALAYYASLAFVRHVNLPAVVSVTALLDQPDLPRIGYLGIGQVIGKFCQEHSCETVPEVQAALAKIVSKIGNGKTTTRGQENIVTSALKALGNAKYLDEATLQKIVAIAADKSVRNRVRVAAIGVLPVKCSMAWKNILLKTLADLEEDSEVRIKSYLSLVECPCPHVANALKEVLDNEKINQVGSFITSHLRNLRASADPNKRDAQRQLGLIKSRTKFPEDFRKFSFNNELSYAIDAFGVGSTVETNVIYSQNSFIPRSSSLNLTTEIFGRSFNFLELDARVENLDRIIERFIGPKGYLKKGGPENVAAEGFDYLKTFAQQIRERLEKSARGKREVKPAELEKFAKNVHLRGNEVDDELDLDLSVKLFGVELAYMSIEGNNQKYTPEYIVGKIFDVLDKGIDKAKDFNYNIENHLLFLDADLIYPTGLGLALSLGVTGSSVVHLKTSGKIDLPAIIKDPENALVKLALEPSASIRIEGRLIVQGFQVESGLKVVSTLHTATGSEVTVKVLEGKGVDVNLGMLKRKQEFVSVSSEVLLSSGPKGDNYVSPKFGKGREHADCFDQSESVFGFTFCGRVTLPYDSFESFRRKPLFPLSGPAKLAVYIDNVDVTNYHFKAFYNTKNPKARSFEILLETPNSRTNRYLSLLVEAAVEPDRLARVTFAVPMYKASAEAILKDNDKERSLTLAIRHDQIEYFGKIGVIADGNKYKPVLEYKVPEHIERLAGSKLGGKPVKSDGQLYSLGGAVEVVDHEGGKKYTFDKVVLTSSGRKVVGLDGTLIATASVRALDAKLSYGEEVLDLKLNGKRLKENHYSLTVAAVPSKDPNVAFRIEWEYQRETGKFEQNLVFAHGPEAQQSENRLILNQRAAYNLDPKNFALGFSNKVLYPALHFLLKLEGAFTKKSLQSEIVFEYEKFKFGTELSAKTGTTKPGDYQIEFEGHVLKNKVELKAKRVILSDTKSKFENSLELSPGGKYVIDAVVIHDVKPNDINVKLDGDVNLNGKKIKVDTGLESNPQKINSHAQVSVDSTPYVDFVLKIQRGNSPSGNIVLNVKTYITASGQFTYQNGKGNADVNIDIPKISRKIKGSGDVSITGTQHSANLEVLYDAEKDPSKRIKLSTVSDITKSSIDMKNVIEILSYKTEVNIKGKLQGKLTDGSLNGDIDVTLPNGHYIVFTGKRAVKKNGDTLDGQAQFELAHHVTKGGPARKIIYSAEGKVFNIDDVKKVTFQSKHDVKLVNSDGKDIHLIVGLKNLKGNADIKNAAVDVKLSGSVIPKPFQFDVDVEYSLEGGSWKGKSSLGSDTSLQSNGKYSRGNRVDKPTTFSGTAELKLPSDKLKNLKLEFSDSILIPREAGGLIEVIKSATLVYNDDQKIKLNSHVKHSGVPSKTIKSEGSGNIVLTVLTYPSLTIDGKYAHDPTADTKKGSISADVAYGDKKTSIAVDSEYLLDLSSVNTNIKATTPIEKLKNINLQFTHKREKDGQIRSTDVSVTADNAKYTMKSEIQLDSVSPSAHLVFTCPAGKTEILSKLTKLGEREFKGELKLDSPKALVTSDYHVKLESVDDFVITVNFDCDKMKPRKIHAEVANKPAKTGRKIIVTVTSDGKNIISGSTDYKKHLEAGKVIVEGKGSLKIGENTESSLFKYTRQELTKETDNEIGSAILLNASFGPSAIVGELKVTNKEIRVFNSYCEQSKDCAHFKLQSLLDSDVKTHLNHQLTVEVDLKKFNVPAEFGLKTSTKYVITDPSYDHTSSLYLHSSKDKTEYTTHLYANTKESGAVLTLPSRELAIISSYEIPTTKHTGAYKVDIALYLDRKNKPADKTGVSANGHVNIEKNTVSLNGEAKLTYPSQPKEMIVKGKLHCGGENLVDANLDIDLFAKKSQKINVVAKVARVAIPQGFNYTNNFEITSRGQQLKVELREHLALSTSTIDLGSILSYTDEHQKPKSVGVLFSANQKEVHLLLLSPNKELIKYDSKMEFTPALQKIESELSVLTNKPIVLNFEAKDMNSFKFSKYVKDKPNTKLSGHGRFVLGQLGEIHVDTFKEGEKKSLFFALIHLDEGKFLKPDFGYNKENIVSAVEYIRGQALEYIRQIKDIVQNIGEEIASELKDLAEHLKKAQPNLKPLIEHYQAELTKLKEELHADETVKEIQATLNQLFGGVIAAITETVKLLTERLEELQKQLNAIVDKLTEAVKAAWPQIKESYQKILTAAVDVIDATSTLATTYLEAILSLINEHQKELKQLATVAAELAQDIAKIIFKATNQIEKDVKDFVTQLVQQLKALPVYELIKEKYQNLADYQIPQAILAPIEELCLSIKGMLPTEELKELFTITYNYILKLVKREKVDDTAEIKNIYTHTIAAAQSILKLVQPYVTVENVFNYIETRIPVDPSFIWKLPGITTLKISLLNLLRNNELPSPADLYYAYRPTLILEDILPPFSKLGLVIDGGHFFTFDGHHFSMPGSCSYILSQDIQDGNFTVVANFNNGNLASITVTDPKESMTVKSNGNILVNDKPAEFPATTENLKGFLTLPLINIKSKYGVHVMCTKASPVICSVHVSGFYLGRLRGLLGDGNNERYDDFTLPSGKIAASATEFGNSYRVSASCPTATAADYLATPRADVCTEYFSGNSPMSSCFKYVNPAHYRQTCDQAVSAGAKKGPCLVATAYYASCRFARVFVNVPDACGTCKEGQNEIATGDAFSVKIPKKEADVILVVEQSADNEKVFKELVNPLITELRNELKQHGMTDVHIGLIGFSEKMKWPQHYTTGGSTNIDGEVKNMKFDKLDPTLTLEDAKDGDAVTRLNYATQRLINELGIFSLTDAYEEAIRYPFRPGAAKTIIGVFTSPCEKSALPISIQQLRLLLGHKVYRDLGLTYHHMFLSDSVQVSGKPQKNVVGFDYDSAYTFADSKKKPLEGSTELKSNLVLTDNDVCANFAVQSGGAAFSTHNFLDAKPNQKKQFLQVAARRVSEGLADLELEEDCVCQKEFGIRRRASCKIVNRNEKGVLARSKGSK